MRVALPGVKLMTEKRGGSMMRDPEKEYENAQGVQMEMKARNEDMAINALRAQELANDSPELDSDSGDLISGKRTEERTETHARDYAELPWIPCKKQLPVKEGDYFVNRREIE